MESFPIAWKRIEPTVSDRSAPVAHNRTMDFPDAVGPSAEPGARESRKQSDIHQPSENREGRPICFER